MRISKLEFTIYNSEFRRIFLCIVANNNKPFKCTKAYINLSAIEAQKKLYPLTKVALSYFFNLIPNKYIYSNPILFVSKIWSLFGNRE